MSFHWNLSDGEEEGEDEGDVNWAEWIQKSNGKFDRADDDEERSIGSGVSWEVTQAQTRFSSFASAHDIEEQEDDDDDNKHDDNSVDWEDANDMDDDNDDKKPAPKTRTIQIDLNSQTEQQSSNKMASTTKKDRRRRRVNQFRVETLPDSTQALVRNLHQAHVLALTSRAAHQSQSCSDSTILAVAHSLIPPEWVAASVANQGSIGSTVRQRPDMATLRRFMDWYIDWVHGARDRRELQRRMNTAAGASDNRRNSIRRKRVQADQLLTDSDASAELESSTKYRVLQFASYLSSTNDMDPQLVERGEVYDNDKEVYVELLIAMVRSMGWRARFVQAIEPIPLDLTVDHPILATSFLYGNLWTAIWNQRLGGEDETNGSMSKKRKTSRSIKKSNVKDSNHEPTTHMAHTILGWAEILCVDSCGNGDKLRWVHVDPIHKLVDRPDQVEILDLQYKSKRKRIQGNKRSVIAYAVGADHHIHLDKLVPTGSDVDYERDQAKLRLTDVTPRYAESWVASLRKRGILRSKKCSIKEKLQQSWWAKTLKQINADDRKNKHSPEKHRTGTSIDEAIPLDDVDVCDAASIESTCSIEEHESDELTKQACSEAIPTSKAAFSSHPVYAIKSEMGKAEVLAPDAGKRVCGVFKGQLVYLRADVSTALTAKKWLYEGRKVDENQMKLPIMRRKARQKPMSNGSFKALRSYGVGASNDGDEKRQIQQGAEPLADGMEELYALWQTSSWSPPIVNLGDSIPVNEFKNIELALINPGLVHIDQKGLAVVAKNLGIPYAPCLLGFEGGRGGHRTPLVRGIVVHEHNAQLVREAGVEVHSHAIEQECQDRRHSILLRWKRLMVGLLTKDRIEREYGSDDNE